MTNQKKKSNKMDKVDISISKESMPLAGVVDDDVVMLPAAVVFSIQAGRKELMKLAIGQVTRGEIIVSQELVIALMATLAKYIDDNSKLSGRVDELEEDFDDIRSDMKQIGSVAALAMNRQYNNPNKD